jgi:hypothetical protein
MELTNSYSYICLEKLNDQWRLDGRMLGIFIDHVSHYFKLVNLPSSLDYNQFSYAEISSDDLYMISAIFGAYSPDGKNMILAPVNPGTSILPWLGSFSMQLFEKNKDREGPYQLIFKAQ